MLGSGWIPGGARDTASLAQCSGGRVPDKLCFYDKVHDIAKLESQRRAWAGREKPVPEAPRPSLCAPAEKWVSRPQKSREPGQQQGRRLGTWGRDG